MVVNMIETGEISGALDSTLGKISEFYTDNMKGAIATFAKIFPKVIYAIIVIFIVMQLTGQYRDYFSMYDGILE